MTLSILAIVIGLILLVYGAERFVYGAAGTANALGVSPLIIGLTIVGFGTSAPEILVSGTAAINGNPGLGFGNAIGSNITNIALVLGVAALIMPLQVDSQTLRREFPALLLVSIGAYLLVMDGAISLIDSVILLSSIFLLLGILAVIAMKGKKGDPIDTEFAEEIPHDVTVGRGILWFSIGLILLLGSSNLLVWGAVNIAHAYGISDLVIGLTIVAIGTSLPELAASAMSAVKKEHELIIGNIIGSNMFNLLAVIGVAGIISPGEFPADAIDRDLPIMLVLTAGLFIMAYGLRGPGKITRIEGAILLAGFVAYQYILYTVSLTP
ncbi:MAG: calcium/sodium antiporter [Gammaproteobacteria bacterium]|nr:calcium/sodium antiporter [Gammaproteobacteria bacterium]